MNKTFGFFKNTPIGQPGSPQVTPTFNISVTYGDTSTFKTLDYTTVTYSITSNLPNATVYYSIEDLQGNLQADDFIDNTLTGNITLNSSGNGTISKTIVKSSGIGEGHKKFSLAIRRNSITGNILKQSANTQLYEIIPIVATGGNTTIIPFTDLSAGPVQGAKFHSFSNAATETFQIVNYGNFVGNTSVWENQFVTPTDSYWNQHPITGEKGLRFRNTIIGGGGAATANVGAGGIVRSINAGGGAGEIGFWSLPLGNIAVGSYSMKVGQGTFATDTGINNNAANTTAFLGNATLEITAVGGGRGGLATNGSVGGCGGGSTLTGGGGATAIAIGASSLAAKASIYAPVVDANLRPGYGRSSGGGGVRGNSPPGFSTSNGGDGWRTDQETMGYAIDSQFIPDIGPNFYACGGGGSNNGAGGSGGQGGGNAGFPGNKGSGTGGGSGAIGGTGLVAIRYPYSNPYRFITANVLI